MAKRSEFEPPLTEGVRKCMKANRSKDTSPELKVRKALREAGYPGYRLNWKKADPRKEASLLRCSSWKKIYRACRAA